MSTIMRPHGIFIKTWHLQVLSKIDHDGHRYIFCVIAVFSRIRDVVPLFRHIDNGLYVRGL